MRIVQVSDTHLSHQGGVTTANLRLIAVFGPDHFAVRDGRWLVLGIDSELLGSGLEEEAAQWQWLGEQLAAPGTDRVLVFCHKPLWLPRTAPSTAALTVPDHARERLLALAGDHRAAVGSGHLHRYRRRPRPERPGILEVWAPSTGFIGQTETESPYFEQLGVVEWRLDAGGVNAWFRAPAGLDEREGTTLGELVRTVAELDAAG